MSAEHSWYEEKRSAWLYQRVADSELDPVRRVMFLELSEAAEKQALLWASHCDGRVQASLSFRPDLRTRVVAGLIGFFGAHRLRFILAAMKVRGMAVFAGVPGSHTAASHLEQRHMGVTHAGNLRAAVFGVNDGLVSNLSLLAGVAGGAAAGHSMVILTGIAGLLAGACSMASGEYISVRSQREFFEYQIELEREELAMYPEEEAGELACIYRARGLSKETARQLADLVISDPERALDTLAREELGLDPAALGSPFGAALSSFLAFAIGASIPLLPFFWIHSAYALYCSAGVTALALMSVGAALSLFSHRGVLFSGLRMLVIGSCAAVVTYFIGAWMGVVLGV